MKELKQHWHRYVFGGLGGVLILLITYCFYTKNLIPKQKDENSYYNFPCVYYNKISHDSLHKLIAVFRKETRNITEIDEKIVSLNTRINDFYIFAGIIITLLLAINISIFIRTDSEVKKHLDENFSHQKAVIEKHLEEAEKLVGRIRVERDMSKAKETSDSKQQP